MPKRVQYPFDERSMEKLPADKIPPIPYEQEKAMRLYMSLNPTGKELKLPNGGEVNIIQRAIEEVVRDIKSDCHTLHADDAKEISRLENAIRKAMDKLVLDEFDAAYEVLEQAMLESE